MEAVFSLLGRGTWESRGLPAPYIALGFLFLFILGEFSCSLHDLPYLPEVLGLTGISPYTWDCIPGLSLNVCGSPLLGQLGQL